MRHVVTPTLWVQKAIKDNKFVVDRVPGKMSMSDTLCEIRRLLHSDEVLRHDGIRPTSERQRG